MTFANLGLSKPILSALNALSISEPTPIQLQAIPPALEGRDIIGLAQTGTGKTAAFALPMIEKIAGGRRAAPGKVHALILSPTRELASQIQKSVRDFSRSVKLKTVLAVGGVSIRPQAKFLSGGADILIATPGRLEDLMRQGAVSLGETRFVVLDEADQMLDIGFVPAIRRILAQTPNDRQTMLFSATMPKEIRSLADRHLSQPVEIAVTPAARTADRIDQGVIHISGRAKTQALSALIHEHDGDRIIVFARTKHGADKIVRRLAVDQIEAAAIHGNKSQGQRERALAKFRAGDLPVLVATDIAARGIDVPGVTLVINNDLPNVPDVYVHRIGRTARAGASGQAITLCAPDERPLLRDIERLIRISVPVLPAPEGLEDADLVAETAAAEKPQAPERRGHRGWSGRPAKAGAGQQKRRRPQRKPRQGDGEERLQERGPKPGASERPERARGQHAAGSGRDRNQGGAEEKRGPKPARRDGGPARAKGRNAAGPQNRNKQGGFQGRRRERAAG